MGGLSCSFRLAWRFPLLPCFVTFVTGPGTSPLPGWLLLFVVGWGESLWEGGFSLANCRQEPPSRPRTGHFPGTTLASSYACWAGGGDGRWWWGRWCLNPGFLIL